MFVPFTNTSPLDGCNRAPATDNNVLFPDPDGPIIATKSPGLTDNETFFNARTVESPSLNDFVTFFNTNRC